MGIGYARIRTNLEGKICHVEDISSIDFRDEFCIEDCIELLKEYHMDEKDADMLVVFNIYSVRCGTYDVVEYDDEVSFHEKIVLQRNIKEKFKSYILEIDAEISKMLSVNISEDVGVIDADETKEFEAAKNYLYELHDDYLEAYEEDIEIRN